MRRWRGASASAAFASGSAATAAVFQALDPGAHVIAPDDAYYGTPAMLREQFARWGLQTTFVDMTDPGAVKRALTPSTRLIWIETPSNPRLHVTDIVAMVALAKTIGARTVVDNTWATPVLQRPLELGVDFVMHSTTKYLSGHSDVLGGAVVARTMDGVFERIRSIQTTLGAVPSPFDCWLVLRGLRSLPYRMRGHVEGAQRGRRISRGAPGRRAGLLSGIGDRPGLRGGRAGRCGSPAGCCRSTCTAAGPRRSRW